MPRDIQAHITKISAQYQQILEEKQRDETIEIVVKVIAEAFDRSTAYANIIILAGYAGFFATWSFVKDYLTERSTIITALLMVLSVIVFVAWEMFKMILGAKDLNRLSHLVPTPPLSPEQFFKRLNRIQNVLQIRKVSLVRYWYVVLTTTVLAGFGAGFILVYNFIAKLTGLPLWP